MSAAGIIGKVAVGTTVIAAAAGVCLYESMLNIKIANRIGEKINVVPAAPQGEEKEKTPEEIKIEAQKANYAKTWSSWYQGIRHQDIFIEGESGKKRHALLFMNEKPSDNWAIILHGYTSDPNGMAEFAYCYNKMGFNCILPSMIGHYKDPSVHASMGWKDRYMVYDFIKYILLLNKDARIVIHGVSMGGATTMLTTGLKLPENVKAAVADCGYTNVYSQYYHVAEEKGILYLLPLLDITSLVSQIGGNLSFRKCSPEEAVRHSETPTLFVHGECDAFVPYEMCQKVYDACAAPKEKFSVKNAAHAESSWQDPDLYWHKVYNFLKEKFNL